MPEAGDGIFEAIAVVDKLIPIEWSGLVVAALIYLHNAPEGEPNG